MLRSDGSPVKLLSDEEIKEQLKEYHTKILRSLKFTDFEIENSYKILSEINDKEIKEQLKTEKITGIVKEYLLKKILEELEENKNMNINTQTKNKEIIDLLLKIKYNNFFPSICSKSDCKKCPIPEHICEEMSYTERASFINKYLDMEHYPFFRKLLRENKTFKMRVDSKEVRDELMKIVKFEFKYERIRHNNQYIVNRFFYDDGIMFNISKCKYSFQVCDEYDPTTDSFKVQKSIEEKFDTRTIFERINKEYSNAMQFCTPDIIFISRENFDKLKNELLFTTSTIDIAIKEKSNSFICGCKVIFAETNDIYFTKKNKN
jgi:hypothetical protein